MIENRAIMQWNAYHGQSEKCLKHSYPIQMLERDLTVEKEMEKERQRLIEKYKGMPLDFEIPSEESKRYEELDKELSHDVFLGACFTPWSVFLGVMECSHRCPYHPNHGARYYS